MVKDDFWLEPTDNLNDVEALNNRGNIPVFDPKTDITQSLQLAINEDAISSSQPPIIGKTSLSAPIIYEDIWGEKVDDPSIIETLFSPDPIIKEWTEDDDHLFLSENNNEISASAVASSFAAHENATDFL